MNPDLNTSAPSPERSADAITRISLDPPPLPPWLEQLLPRRVEELLRDAECNVRARDGGRLLWIEASVPRASELDDPGFRSAVKSVYDALGEALRERGQHPIRWWNYLPDIRRASADGFSRYEIFNGGRLESFRGWPDDPSKGRAPAATAVGHRGKDLVVQVLASTQLGVPVENPRQSPAHRYSKRYGPVPPMFARATLTPAGERWAMVSGTASIVGEESRHPGVVSAQLAETLTNLASIARAIEQAAGVPAVADPLERYRDVRAYVVRSRDLDAVAADARRAFPALRCFEVAEADLCRPELLVELEGLVELG